MRVTSLGHRTDLIFPAFEGEIVDRGDHIAVRTPSNATFYWGNFLLFSHPPREGDFRRWRELFEKAIGTPPEVEHQAFAWDSLQGEAGVVGPFVQAGFDVDPEVVLTATAPHAPARPAASATIRLLESDADWLQAVDLQVQCRDQEHREAGYRLFRERGMARYRRMAIAELGSWYGAFVGDRMVADLGVFHDRQGLGRYQSVETHPDFRRQGIAGTLIYEAGRESIARHGLHTLVIVAEEGAAPARLYQALGFMPTGKSVGLLWFPRADQPKMDL